MKNIIKIMVSIIIFIIILPLMIILDILRFFTFIIAIFLWLYDESCKDTKFKNLCTELCAEFLKVSVTIKSFITLFKK